MAINQNFIIPDAGLVVGTTANVGTTLGVTGAVTFSNTLNITGGVTASNTLGVTGAATFSNTFTVTGVANLQGGANTTLINATTGVNIGVNHISNTTTVYISGGTNGSTLTANANQITVGNSTVYTTITGSSANVGGSFGVVGASTFSGNVTISGNLTVTGSTTYVNTAVLAIADNIITLNSDVSGVPTENAGVEVNRGTSANVSIIWNETTDTWQITTNGTNFGNVHSDLVDITLGTQTAGAYVANVSSGTSALTITGAGGETSTPAFAIRSANTTVDGIVQLIDGYNSTSITLAATANAVNAAVSYALTTAANATNLTNGTLPAARLPTSGVTAGTYGNSSNIPQFTVDATGRVTSASNVAVAGVSSYTYTPANSTFTIGTSAGSTFSANIQAANATVQGLIQVIDSTTNTSVLIAGSANSVTTAYNAAIAANTLAAGKQAPLTVGNGLTGTINTSGGTLSVNQGLGAVVNSSGVHVNANNGIVANSTGTFVLAGNSMVSNSTGVHFIGNTGVLSVTGTTGRISIGGTATAPTVDLAANGPGAGTYGSAGVSSITVDGYGRVTGVGTATYLTGITSGQVTTALGYTPYNNTNPANFANSTNGNAISGAAGSVAWTNVTGRPTNVSTFTNDAGYLTSSTQAIIKYAALNYSYYYDYGTRYVPGTGYNYTLYGAKNISSLTYNTLGDLTVNFTSGFSNTNYKTFLQAPGGGTYVYTGTVVNSNTAVRLTTKYTGNSSGGQFFVAPSGIHSFMAVEFA